MNHFVRLDDGSLEDSDGNIIFFSLERFEKKICNESHCFLCGASPHEKEFNHEHVIPRWVLRHVNIFDKSIVLPNGESVKYSKYTIPCCSECNTFLGREIEEEVRSVVCNGLDYVNEYVRSRGAWKIFLWLALIFLKTHLKDTYLRKHLDRRKGSETIASDYDWSLIHHVHVLVRAIQTGAHIEDDCFGTTAILPAKVSNFFDNFDYRDAYSANTILLRINDIAFLSVFDDSCAVAHFFTSYFERITGPLSPVQLREVLSHLTLLNIKLKYRPDYGTKLDARTGKISIFARLPERMELDQYDKKEFGEILYSNVFDYIKNMGGSSRRSVELEIREGNCQFLFDDEGVFLDNHMQNEK